MSFSYFKLESPSSKYKIELTDEELRTQLLKAVAKYNKLVADNGFKLKSKTIDLAKQDMDKLASQAKERNISIVKEDNKTDPAFDIKPFR